MALVQAVKDGKVVDQKNDPANKKKEATNEMGQDQFLQLLVAQMQYQDPLEPTSNTEWVAQMATFSMVESLNGMKETMTEQSAYDLVGKYVLIQDGDNYVKGKVDYITKQNGETVLSVDDKFYTLDKLDTIADQEYFEGSVQANELHEMIQLLPGEENLTALDDGLLKSAREAYDKLTDSQKAFLEKEDIDKLTALETKMEALKATYFAGKVKKLPTAQEIQDADPETLAEYAKSIKEARDYYNDMTKKQQEKVREDALDTLKACEEALEKAGGTTTDKDDANNGNNGSVSNSDVTALLEKILAEIQNQKKPEDSGTEQEKDPSESGGTENQQEDGQQTQAS